MTASAPAIDREADLDNDQICNFAAWTTGGTVRVV
jgi:hypothetical protein